MTLASGGTLTEVASLAGLQKSYWGRPVLKGVNLSLRAGVFYSLAGRNGAGKSTLLRVLSRLEAPSQGMLKLFGLDASQDLPDFNARLQLVTESLSYGPMRLEEIRSLLASFHSRWDSALIDRLWQQLELRGELRYSSLSRGQKMQVAMGFALAARPELLILDEVTSVLDARARFILLREAKSLVEVGSCVVLATNIVTEIHSIADRMLLIEGGVITVDLDLQRPDEAFVRVRVRPSVPFQAPSSWVPLEMTRTGDSVYVLRRADLPSSLPPGFEIDSRAPRPEEIFILISEVRS